MHSVSADGQRVYQLYYYLCSCLAITQNSNGTLNFKGTGNRLSDVKDFRKAVSLIFQGEAAWFEEKANSKKAATITTGDVVKMLERLDKALKEDYKTHREPYSRVLTLSDILLTLHRVIELTPQEREALDLPAGDGLTLLQQALLNLQVVGGIENYEMLFRVYKAAVGLDFAQAEPPLKNLAEVDALVEQTVHQRLKYLPDRQGRSRSSEDISDSRDATVLKLTQKAQREIRRILARSGNQQSLAIGSVVVESYINHYLQRGFVVKLAQAVVTNERLTDHFPVYLKRISIEPSGPLPFADRELGILQSEGHYPDLLHPALSRLNPSQKVGRTGELPGPGDYELASQEATRLTVDFYIKVPKEYLSAVPEVFQQLASANERRIDFSMSSTGIGGTLSHIMKVLNRALLRDISCLKNYFAIAHDVTSTQTIIRENVASPVWSHSLVKLCRKQTIGQTIQECSQEQLRSYEEFSYADPIGHGDYCGFDFLLAQAQASLQARLQAIRNAGINPTNYIQHLCQRTELDIALENAWSYLRGYPFSTLAMIGAINRDILQPGIDDRPLQAEDPYIYFEACLSIVETLLDEGAYRLAQQYLQRLHVLEDYVQHEVMLPQTTSEGNDSFQIFSGALIVRYLICKATYLYIYDDSEESGQGYLPPGYESEARRELLVQGAWRFLDQAQQHIWLRLRKYVVINEVSQGTFHPHYSLLARIAFLRMKLLLFFPRYVLRDEVCLETERFSGQRRIEASIHWGRLSLAEKARLYAAAEGDSEIYACYAAFQTWLHLIAAYTSEENLTLPPRDRSDSSQKRQTLSQEECLRWARRLRDHALISYANTGRYCYNQIKEKSGLPRQTEEFGLYSIQKLPAIYEARKDEYAERSASSDDDFLVLDMSLLAVDVEDLPKLSSNHPNRNIYLFGTNACYLFFARGLYLLCSNTSEEFDESEPLEQEIQWMPKLRHAMRLLNMAWAISEDGGRLEEFQVNGEQRFNIQRSWKSEEPDTEGYSTLDMASVKDLYPRRVAEINDLSKLFSAACMALRLRLLAAAERELLAAETNNLLDALHKNIRRNPTLRRSLAHQEQYNKHLSIYTSKAKEILVNYINSSKMDNRIISGSELREQRDLLVKQLFEALIE